MRRRDAPRGARSVRLLVAASVLTATAGSALAGWTVWQAAAAAPAAVEQQRAASQVESGWRARPSASAPSRLLDPAALRVDREPGARGVVATIRVPRFGASWSRTVRQGVGEEVLNAADAGVGHYPGTAMPGGLGAFAVAGHDTGWGDAFRGLGTLRVGDEVRVRTRLGEYVYAFRDFRWVPPTAVDVLLPVPGRPGARVGARLITITTCDPPYHAEERFVAYGSLVAVVRAGGERQTVGRPPVPDPAGDAVLRAALHRLGPAPSRPAVVRAVEALHLGRGVEATADRTSVGRPVPAIQVAVRRGRSCLLGQAGQHGVRTAVADPVNGRCLIDAAPAR